MPETGGRRAAGHARRGPAADDRRGPPAGPRAGAAGRLDRRRRQERLGGRHGSRTPARSTPRRRTPRTTRTTTARSPTTDPIAVHRPGRVRRLRARLRVQDDDRRARRSRQGTVTTHDPHQGRGHAAARRRPDQDRRRRPQGHGLDDVRGRHRLLAQRRRREGRARPRRRRPTSRRRSSTTCGRGSGSASRPGSTSPARVGRHYVHDPAITPLARDRPRQRRVRAGRGGHADPARDARTPRWSTAARSSSPTSSQAIGAARRRAAVARTRCVDAATVAHA